MAWNDEFEGSSLDSTKWNTGTYPIANNGYGGVTYIAANNNAGVLKLEDGYLKLNNKAVANQDGGYDYYTPEICTNKTYGFSYGYFEMRAKLTSGNPLWHSFWACGQSTEEKPYKVEIDVIETGATGANLGKYEYTLHSWWDAGAENLPNVMVNNNSGHNVLANGTVRNKKLTSDFHTYGCLWTDTSITFYLDGTALKTIVYSSQTNPEYYQALKEGNPMFLFLSLSTARKYAGSINNAALENQVMLVDYVRVYQDTAIAD